jgi:hypothetical protein
MGLAVVTVAAGGLPVVDVTAIAPRTGTPVTEAVNGRGVSVTKVAARGLPVVFEMIGVAPGVTYATWDAATVTAVTLSGGGLVATSTGTTSVDQGAHVASATGKTGGKYYFEITWTTVNAGGNVGLGVGTTTSTYTGMGNGGTTGVLFYKGFNAWSMGVKILTWSASLPIVDERSGIAADLDNRKFWFRNASTAGIWNNSGTANPATNTGGLTIPAGTMVPFCTFGGTLGGAGGIFTANFGASAFVGAVPAGFTPGWPA